jgi:hypothetical protein
MNYCLIEDAWRTSINSRPSAFAINSDYSDKYNNEKKNIIENFADNNIDYNMENCFYTCNNFWQHLDSCDVCRNKIRERYSFKLIERIQIILLDNKDTILLILIILFLLVFFNLLISIFKK